LVLVQDGGHPILNSQKCCRHLEFAKKCYYGPLVTLVFPVFITTHLLQICQELAKIYPVVHFPKRRLPPSRIGQNTPFYIFSKMAAAAIFNTEKVIF